MRFYRENIQIVLQWPMVNGGNCFEASTLGKAQVSAKIEKPSRHKRKRIIRLTGPDKIVPHWWKGEKFLNWLKISGCYTHYMSSVISQGAEIVNSFWYWKFSVYTFLDGYLTLSEWVHSTVDICFVGNFFVHILVFLFQMPSLIAKFTLAKEFLVSNYMAKLLRFLSRFPVRLFLSAIGREQNSFDQLRVSGSDTSDNSGETWKETVEINVETCFLFFGHFSSKPLFAMMSINMPLPYRKPVQIGQSTPDPDMLHIPNSFSRTL